MTYRYLPLPLAPLLLVLLAAVYLQAAPAQQQPWPKRVAEPVFVSVRSASLTDALRLALMRWDEFTQGKTELPELLRVARIDLNGDQTDEFIVQSAQSYSGGPMMFVFEHRYDKFVEIGTMQGAIYFGPRANGYFDIVTQSRSGGGEYTRTLERYERRRYEPIRIADYRESESGGPLQFVQERNPDQFRSCSEDSDWRHVLESTRVRTYSECSKVVEALKQGIVTTGPEAVSRATAASGPIKAIGGSPVVWEVSALLLLELDDAELGKAGSPVWEVRGASLDGRTVRVVWVGAITGKTRTLF